MLEVGFWNLQNFSILFQAYFISWYFQKKGSRKAKRIYDLLRKEVTEDRALLKEMWTGRDKSTLARFLLNFGLAEDGLLSELSFDRRQRRNHSKTKFTTISFHNWFGKQKKLNPCWIPMLVKYFQSHFINVQPPTRRGERYSGTSSNISSMTQPLGLSLVEKKVLTRQCSTRRSARRPSG